MKRQIGIVMAAWLLTTAFLHADTSNLLIQGPFGSGGSEETFKWSVSYPTGDLVTGQDLLYAVFGQPTYIGTYTDGLGDSPYPEYQSGSGSQSLDFIDFGGGSYFPIAFTLGGTTVLQDPSYYPGWSYYVAGGGGEFGPDDDGDGTPYTSGTWTYSNDGSTTRTLADGSYDGWVFGGTSYSDPPPTIDDSSGMDAPTSAEFSGTNSSNTLSANSIPEPSATLLICAAALAGIVAFNKRVRA